MPPHSWLALEILSLGAPQRPAYPPPPLHAHLIKQGRSGKLSFATHAQDFESITTSFSTIVWIIVRGLAIIKILYFLFHGEQCLVCMSAISICDPAGRLTDATSNAYLVPISRRDSRVIISAGQLQHVQYHQILTHFIGISSFHLPPDKSDWKSDKIYHDVPSSQHAILPY